MYIHICIYINNIRPRICCACVLLSLCLLSFRVAFICARTSRKIQAQYHWTYGEWRRGRWWWIWKNNDSIALMVTAARLQMVDEGDDQSAMIATSGSWLWMWGGDDAIMIVARWRWWWRGDENDYVVIAGLWESGRWKKQGTGICKKGAPEVCARAMSGFWALQVP